MGPETEARLGYQEHQKIVPQIGGAYADPAIDAYVTARHSAERYGQTMAGNILGLGLGILLGGGAQAAPPRHPPRETRRERGGNRRAHAVRGQSPAPLPSAQRHHPGPKLPDRIPAQDRDRIERLERRVGLPADTLRPSLPP